MPIGRRTEWVTGEVVQRHALANIRFAARSNVGLCRRLRFLQIASGRSSSNLGRRRRFFSFPPWRGADLPIAADCQEELNAFVPTMQNRTFASPVGTINSFYDFGRNSSTRSNLLVHLRMSQPACLYGQPRSVPTTAVRPIRLAASPETA